MCSKPKILLVANPAAQNGKGHSAALRAFEAFGEKANLVFTKYPKHATSIIEEASVYDQVIAIGGDGIVHECVLGLMRLPKNLRPTFGLIPTGSGNDYAQTLGMSFDLPTAVKQISEGITKQIDIGCCNGEYFVETLSFGMDAAIALDVEKRRKQTGKTGIALYTSAGLDQFAKHYNSYNYKMTLDGKNVYKGCMTIIAIQIGRTYGGGFKICPDAVPNDGLFDICYADGPVSRLYSLYVFLRAKNGQHYKYKMVHNAQASSINLKFDKRPPVQIDGEPHIADEYNISILRKELSVLVGNTDWN